MGKYDMDSVEASLDKYEREIGEREYIVSQCPINIYCSSINPRWAYPYKLMSYWEARDSVQSSADTVIIDSGFQRYGEMGAIIDAAKRHDARWLIPPDITPYFYCYDEISAESRAKELARHAKTFERKDLETKMILPLHRPIEANLEALDAEGLLEKHPAVAVGLKGLSVPERIEILGTIDQYTSPETHVHALSPGTELEMLAFMRENPHMVDSLDVSTPEQAPANNKIPDNTWHQHVVPFPTGKDVSTLRAMRTLEIILSLNYMLGPLCNDSEFAECLSHPPVPADD